MPSKPLLTFRQKPLCMLSFCLHLAIRSKVVRGFARLLCSVNPVIYWFHAATETTSLIAHKALSKWSLLCRVWKPVAVCRLHESSAVQDWLTVGGSEVH